MKKRYKLVVWYPPKKKFITLESNINQRRALGLATYIQSHSFPMFVRPSGKKLKRVV